MSDLREMLFAIEITLVGITAGVLSIPHNCFRSWVEDCW